MQLANPQETQRVWLDAYLRDRQGAFATMQRMAPGNAYLPSQQISAVLNWLLGRDQFIQLNWFPVAQALSAYGYPTMLHEVAQERQDLGGATNTFNQMLNDAYRHGAQSQAIQRQTQADVTQIISETTAYQKAVFDKMNRLNTLCNEGVPYAQALAIVEAQYGRL